MIFHKKSSCELFIMRAIGLMRSLLSTVHNAYVADVPLQKDRWNFLVISLFKYNWDASGPTMRCKRVQKVQSSCGRAFANYFSFPLFCITCLSEKYKYEILESAFYWITNPNHNCIFSNLDEDIYGTLRVYLFSEITNLQTALSNAKTCCKFSEKVIEIYRGSHEGPPFYFVWSDSWNEFCFLFLFSDKTLLPID